MNQFSHKNIIIVLCVLASTLSSAMFYSCSNDNRMDCQMRIVLDKAGDNKFQLKKVLDHYRNDSLKLEAAKFLIANMPYHYSYSDTTAISHLYNTTDSLIEKLNGIENESLKDSIIKSHDINRLSTQSFRYDIEYLSAEYIIWNIDQAFETWHTSPFCRHLDFEEFCEYILPYKSGELQATDNWREKYSNLFIDSLSLIQSCSTFSNSSYRAAEAFNNCLIDSFHPESANVSRPFLPYSIETQLAIPFGTCDDYCRAAVPLFRAAGIPVMHDYIPCWGYSPAAHGWLVVKAHTGKDIPFVPFYGSPKTQHKIDETKAKVYRHTYAVNHDLKKLNTTEEWVPLFFRNIFQQDVTAEYVKPHSVTENCEINDGRFVYLAVSQHKGWTPVDFTEVKKGNATFNDLGANCVYILVTYDRNGQPKYLSEPFLLNLDGSITPLIASKETQKATLYRKSPLLEYSWAVAVTMTNNTFEASNDKNFKEYTTVAKVGTPADHAGEINIPDDIAPYRYWRFINRDKRARCHVAEIAFLDHATDERLFGTVYQYPNSTHPRAATLRSHLFDNDVLHSFRIDGENEAWVAVDFGKPVRIGKIQYTPRSDGNMIEPGDEYELYYWNDGQWNSLGCKTATTVSITYDNIPQGALLLLHNRTKGQEERIFILSNVKAQQFK